MGAHTEGWRMEAEVYEVSSVGGGHFLNSIMVMVTQLCEDNE